MPKHLKIVDDPNQYLKELDDFRKILEQEFDQFKKFPKRMPTLSCSSSLFPYAHALILEYEAQGFKAEVDETLGLVTIRFVRA